jgi:uncharacterized protein YdaU (DUF1376 family)
MEINKFHALQLFTDTFAAETVHLSNSKVGIYIRLLCFSWTKNTKPFTTDSAYRICQCIDNTCFMDVYEVLEEFFKIEKNNDDRNKITWIHKRLVQEHDYLTNKYKARSEAGRKGGLASSKIKAPIPSPKPIPNNEYDACFDELWKGLSIKRGSKYKAFQLWQKLSDQLPESSQIILSYNNQIKEIEDKKFIPHFSTWLSQKRWEVEEMQEIPNLIERMQNLGYLHKGSEGQFEKFSKDGKNYRIDKFDKKHQVTIEQ